MVATKDNLLFTFLLSGNADNLKELYSRAQGEVSIREALRELDLWGAGANFCLTGYMDSAAKELSIIKDWKELVNQVSIIIVNTFYTCICMYMVISLGGYRLSYRRTGQVQLCELVCTVRF